MVQANPISVLISCEHASNRVPRQYQHLFIGHEDLLNSHRGWDAGALQLAKTLASRLDAPLLTGEYTRLLVDLNRSRNHSTRFSEFTRDLHKHVRNEICSTWWQPHWRDYRDHLHTLPDRILHIACHSFTPVFHGRLRKTDIGLLYDPARPSEKAFCLRYGQALRRKLPSLKVHMNQPYRGISNNLGQQHRQHFPDAKLMTFEIEINQRLVEGSGWNDLSNVICDVTVDRIRAEHFETIL
ncbi:MAG: N-formylglutamate amidohydrolase [Pseudomonadota bacterium]